MKYAQMRSEKNAVLRILQLLSRSPLPSVDLIFESDIHDNDDSQNDGNGSNDYYKDMSIVMIMQIMIAVAVMIIIMKMMMKITNL